MRVHVSALYDLLKNRVSFIQPVVQIILPKIILFRIRDQFFVHLKDVCESQIICIQQIYRISG